MPSVAVTAPVEAELLSRAPSPVKEETPLPAPLLAAVIRPLAFTVMLALVNDPTLLFTVAKVVANEPDVVTSPLRLPFVIEVEPEKIANWPIRGVPVVVTVPDPAVIALHEYAFVDVL